MSDWRAALKNIPVELTAGLRLEKVLVNRNGTKMHVCFCSDNLVGENDFRRIRGALRALFPKCEVALRIKSPELGQLLMRDIMPQWEFLRHKLCERLPAYTNFLKNCVLTQQGNKITLEFENDVQLELVRQDELDARLATLVKDIFDADLQFTLAAPDTPSPELEKLRELRRRDEELRTEKMIAEQARAITDTSKKPSTPAQTLLGKVITEPPVKINDISEDMGRIVICGEIVAAESRLTKNESATILNFAVTDYSNTVSCKAFLKHDNSDKVEQIQQLLNYIKPGAYIKVRGQYMFDDYSKEYVVRLSDAAQADKPKRIDKAEVKRVELHMHTQMSNMDGVSSATSLIKQAIDWGHPAIAVTDHGVLQAFPEAFKAAGKDIKFIPGCEGYLCDDAARIVDYADSRALEDCAFVVLDVETTGLNRNTDKITELGAVRIEHGQEVAEFSELINPEHLIPEKVTELTGINEAMVHDCRTIEQAAPDFAKFCEGAVLVAHNAEFDMSFIRRAFETCAAPKDQPVLDTLALARNHYKQLKNYKLGTICKQLGISLKDAHRAVHDARATSQVLVRALDELKAVRGIKTLDQLNDIFDNDKGDNTHHIILLAASQDGLTNLNRITSEAHLKHFYKRPRIPRSLLQKYRKDIIVGSACEAGELFRAMVEGRPESELLEIASFYDYLEIQPIGNNAFMIREGAAPDEEALRDYNRHILAIGDRLGKLTVATCDVHFLEARDAQYRAILMAGRGFEDADQQAPLYLRTTDEMLREFEYLGDRAYEVVVENTRKIADMVGNVKLFLPHPKGEETFQPFWPEAADNVRSMAETRAREVYGNPLPEIVQARLDKELKSIIGYGFATLYNIAQKLVKKSTDDGYLVGSRGSVGSSVVAHFIGITEVNALPPHYVCPKCKHVVFDIPKGYTCGVDLPPATCEKCGADMKRDGFDIPFEVFLGFYGDKVPDIDLNFSGEYQPRAHAYAEELFGTGNVFRAGTIGTLAEKTAYGYVLKYLEERGLTASNAEKERLAAGCVGVKRTTGQHPGGIVVLPKDYEIYQFTAVQHPADDVDSTIITTHYDFGSMHDVLVKLDCLGHDDPTMLRKLQDITGIEPKKIPLNDPGVMSLFTSCKALGVEPRQIYGCKSGTLGIPEFGTRFVRGMLEETQPHTMEELIRIAGLSHGTDVWLGNARELVHSGLAKLKDCICNRDDIMLFLIKQGVEPKIAFTTMESVRKGKGLKPEMEQAMNDTKTPDWFIDSCKKIKYMFPKGHSVAYVTMSLRIAYFKLYYPVAYYACYLRRNADMFDASTMLGREPSLEQQLRELDDKGKEASAKEQNTVTILEVLLEMNARGIHLLPVDIYDSDTEDFKIVGDSIRPPLTSLPNLGLNVALPLAEERQNGPFISIEDMRRRKIGKGTIEMLRQNNCLTGIPETSQMSLFEM